MKHITYIFHMLTFFFPPIALLPAAPPAKEKLSIKKLSQRVFNPHYSAETYKTMAEGRALPAALKENLPYSIEMLTDIAQYGLEHCDTHCSGSRCTNPKTPCQAKQLAVRLCRLINEKEEFTSSIDDSTQEIAAIEREHPSFIGRFWNGYYTERYALRAFQQSAEEINTDLLKYSRELLTLVTEPAKETPTKRIETTPLLPQK